jgi:hypothetical protein
VSSHELTEWAAFAAFEAEQQQKQQPAAVPVMKGL